MKDKYDKILDLSIRVAGLEVSVKYLSFFSFIFFFHLLMDTIGLLHKFIIGN